MAFELGAILARLKMDTSDYEKGADRAENKTRSLGGMLERGVGASTAFAEGLLVVGAALVAAGGFAIASAAGIESTRTAFTTMLKDGDKAGALMKELNTFAAETPFEFPELADAGKKLLAFGFAANEIQPNLRRLGDVAAGLGIPIGELSELYGKAKVQGRLYMEDVNQLTGRGIPIIQEFARQFGVSEGEVRGLIETGKIGFPELQKGIEHMTDAGGMFAGGMAAQSKTVGGLISTLKDNLGAFARDLVGMGSDGTIEEGGLFAAVKNGLVGVITFLDENKEGIKNGIKTAFEFIGQYAPIIAGAIFGALIPALIAAGVAAWGFIAAIAPFVLIGAAIGAAFMLLQPYFGMIGEWITINLLPAWQMMVDKFNEFIAVVIPLLVAAWEFLRPSLEALWNTIVTQLWPALQQLWQLLVDLWNAIAPVLVPILIVLAGILGALIVGAVWLVINVLNIIIGVISWLVNAWTVMQRVVASVWAAVLAIITAVVNTIVVVIMGIVNQIINYFNMLWNVIRTIFQTMVNVVSALMRGDFKGAFDAAVNGIKSIFNTLGGFFKGIWDGILAGVKGVGDGITAPFRAAVDTIKNLMNGAKEALSNLNPFQRHSPSLVDWVKRGTAVIADQYGDMNNSIAAGTLRARQQTIGTQRMLTNISPAQVATQGAGGSGGGGDTFHFHLDGVLADSPEAKRKLGDELISLVNDKRIAKGEPEI